jgi:hypothetical protein
MSARALVTTVGVALVFGAGWVANGWRLDGQHAAELAQRDRQALAVAEQVMAIGRAANAAISSADAKAWKGLEDDKKELRRLRGCVADGTCGVRLIAGQSGHGPSNPGAGSVGHDTVELDPDVQRRVLDHREAIGEDARKIEYLQAYVLQCWRATNGDDGPSR